MQITDYFSIAFEMLKTQTNKINLPGLGFTVSIMQLTHPEAVMNFQQVLVQTDSSTDSVATLEDTHTHPDNSTTNTTSLTRPAFLAMNS